MKQVDQVKLGNEFLRDVDHRVSHDRCLWEARMRRDKTVSAIPEWEEMRELASKVKQHTLSHIDEYLRIFEENARKNGIHVHRAADAEEHNKIMLSILQKNNVKVVTKGKSMLQDECGMREYLEHHGIDIFEADLGERIQQLDNQRPSHIVMPAIHKLRKDVAQLFAEKLGSNPEEDDPYYLNSVMRNDMRKNYVKVDAGMTGVNFAIAETGGIVVCTNEGNADISANVPPLYIASMGIEKLIPGKKELALFIRMLSRNALGFDITQYTSHFHGPREGQEMHVIIVDNGRMERIKSPDYHEVMKCIRCGACMNTCPVFRRTSGLSYDAPYMGPIGIVLEPSYDLYKYAQLPYSCTHCGSCGAICPVKVPLPDLIFYWRDKVVEKGYDLKTHRLEMDVASLVLKNSTNLALAEKTGLWALKHLPKTLTESRLNPWADFHSNPEPPAKTFRQMLQKDDDKKSRNKSESICKCTHDSNPDEEIDYSNIARPFIPSYAVLGDPEKNFKEKLKGFDGDYIDFKSRSEVIEWLSSHIDKTKKIYSSVKEFQAEMTPSNIDDPHDANVIDVCVAEGVIGVGETGSVWVTDKSLGLAASALLSTDLFLLLDRTKIVEGIHAAYDFIDIRSTAYGSFYSGPSATADIEAVHITGAQGEISLTVLLY